MTFFSADVYPGDGSQQTFGLTFDYIDRNSVYVYLIDNTTGAQTELTVIASGVPAAGQYIWDSDTQVRLGDVPTTGQSVKIQRRTDISQQAVQWTGGSYITSDDLNTSEQQNLFVDQELSDWLKEITGGGSGPGDFVDLTDLGDVTITNPVEPEVLRYNGTSSQWVNAPNRNVADQDAGTPSWDDTAQATAGAIARRHDNISRLADGLEASQDDAIIGLCSGVFPATPFACVGQEAASSATSDGRSVGLSDPEDDIMPVLTKKKGRRRRQAPQTRT